MPNTVNTDFSSEMGDVPASTTFDGGIDTPSTDSIERCSVQQWLQSSQKISDTSPPKVSRSAEPTPGNTYIIVAKGQNLVLTCHNGNVFLGDSIEKRRFCQWYCVAKDGFLGFRNTAERTFLGHDIWWDFYAKVPHHKGWEYFRIEKRPCGGYWIQALDWWKFRQLSAQADGRKLYAQASGGTIWEFVEV